MGLVFAPLPSMALLDDEQVARALFKPFRAVLSDQNVVFDAAAKDIWLDQARFRGHDHVRHKRLLCVLHEGILVHLQPDRVA